jgi:transcriptional regulator with XRE-family HTH domain
MAPAKKPIGDILRQRRVEVLGKGLREMAKLLDIAPAHLTDLEKGRRNPSEALLLRIATVYGIDEATLRAGWGRAETVVGEIASKNPTTAAKAPELLRAARNLDAAQWDALIAQAKALADTTAKKTRRKTS